MAAGVEARLNAYAERCGPEGFSFDDLVIAAAQEDAMAVAADWLVRAHRRGFLLDLGSDTLSDGSAITPRRYVVAHLAVGQPRIDMRLPAEPRSVSTMRWTAGTFAGRHAARDPHAVELAVSEAATNSVRHAYAEDPGAGEIRLVACAKPEGLVVVVRDWGPGGIRPRLDTPGLGLGLPLIGQLTDRVEIEPAEGGGTLVRMHFSYASVDVAR